MGQPGVRRTFRRLLLRPSTALVMVGIAVAVIPLASFDLGRYLAYDEAVYLSQVYPAKEPIFFTPHRARGLPWLVAPVALFGPPLWAIRLYLLAISSLLFVVAFRAWLPVIGTVRTIAAAVAFGGGWMTLYYGSELFPNLLPAYGVILAAASFVRFLTTSDSPDWRSRYLWATSGALAFVALIRPTEAAMATVGLVIAAIVATRRARQIPRLLVAWGGLAAGFLAGWLPWVIEAFTRYGGLRARLDAASANVGHGLHIGSLRSHLALVDGPLVGTAGEPVPLLGVALWTVLVTGVVTAFWRSLAHSDHRAMVLAVAGLAVASPYLLTDIVEARFLLPAYALLILGAIAAAPAIRLPSVKRMAAVAVAIALTAWIFINFGVADALESAQAQRREIALQLADALRRRAGDGHCFFASQFAFPEISFASDCRGAPVRPSTLRLTFPESPAGAPVYVLSVTHPDELAVPAVPGTVVSLKDEGASRWWIFIADPEAVGTMDIRQ